MRTHTNVLVLLASVALAFGCDDDPDDEITTRSNPSANFTEYETYAFAQQSDVTVVEDAEVPAAVASNLQVVTNAMRTQLNALGLQEVSADQNPDLTAFNLASTSEQTAVYWGCVGGYWYGSWGYPWNPCAWLAPMYTEYVAGTIVVGLADPQLEQVVFGGVIQGVGEGDDTDELEERINENVAEVFEAYPAQQTGTEQPAQ